MKLATSDKVFARMNLANSLGSTNTSGVDSALEAATIAIESILRTSLKASNVKDYFDYSLGRYSTFSPFTLWLSQRFVNNNPKVYFSLDGKKVDIPTSRLLTVDEYILDPKTGKLVVLSRPTEGYATVLVSYAAGYREGSRSIPSWLEEAAITAAVATQHTQSVSHSSKKGDKDASRPMYTHLYSVLNEYIITNYSGVGPTLSKVT